MRTEPPAAVTFDFWATLVQDTPENLVQASARRVQSLAALLEALGVSPARALHVGDNPDADVLGAQRAGMRTAHYAFAGAAPSSVADFIVKDLAELPRLLTNM